MPTIGQRVRNALRALGGAPVPKQLEAEVVGPQASVQVATLPTASGSRVGWLDPSTSLTPELLYGDSTSPGLLWQIRRTDDVIAPAADSRRELLQSLEYDLVPRPRNEGRPDAEACAKAVEGVLHSMPDRSVPFWVAENYDYWSTFGHAVYEQIIEDNRYRLGFIRPGLICEFVQGPTGYVFARVRVRAARGVPTLDAPKLAYFARNPLPGEFRGASAYRCLIAPSTTSYELYKNLLQAMRWSRGFLHVHATADGTPSANDNEQVQMFLDAIRNGDDEALVTSQAISADVVASNVAAMQQFAPLAQYQSERKNAAALNALNNLGMRGVGSRSLGEVVHEADQALLRAHLDSYMDTVSGDNTPNGTMLPTLAEICGYPRELAPRMVVRWSDKAMKLTRGHIDQIRELVNDGILTSSPALSRFVGRQLGLPSDVLDDPPAAPEADTPSVSTPSAPDASPPAAEESAQNLVEGEKLNGAQITAALEVLDRLRNSAVSDDVAVELLVAVGIDEARARPMVVSTQSLPAPPPDDHAAA